MKCIFWNIRGLGKSGRKQCVMDVLFEYKVDFIGIQETKNCEFDVSYLESLAGVKQFCWNWLPTKGSASGVLMGLDSNVFYVKSWEIKDYIIRCDVVNKREKFECAIVTIYGLAYEENK
jgi:exonuclease III